MKGSGKRRQNRKKSGYLTFSEKRELGLLISREDIDEIEARKQGLRNDLPGHKHGFFKLWELVNWKDPEDICVAKRYIDAGFKGPFLVAYQKKVCLNGSKKHNHQFVFLETLEGKPLSLHSQDESRFSHQHFKVVPS
jgi:hypothetical protein